MVPMLLTSDQLFDNFGNPASPSAIETIHKFIQWRDSKEQQDFIQLVHRGKLKRKDIAIQIQEEQNTKFPKSTLNDNKWVKTLLDELENHLRVESVLPPLTDVAKTEDKKGTSDNPINYDSRKRKAIQDAKRVSELQEVVLQQKARIKQLERQIEHQASKENIYAELASMGASFGN